MEFYFYKKILDALLVCQQQFNGPAAGSPSALGEAAQLPGLDWEQGDPMDFSFLMPSFLLLQLFPEVALA